MTSARQGSDLADHILYWIRDNLVPDDAFRSSDLIYWIKMNYGPDDVFDFEELKQWAEDNGFIENK